MGKAAANVKVGNAPGGLPAGVIDAMASRTMTRSPGRTQDLATRRPARIGRPPRERAGEVETRILDAARDVFLERGLGGASVDEIAARAGAGKPTIYARYPGKEALFTAVVMRDVEGKVTRFEGHVPTGGSIEERLASVAGTLLHWALGGDAIGLLRLAIAEARRFPDLASTVGAMARERGMEAVAHLLGEVAQSDELGSVAAFRPERLPATARFFIDLILLPLMMRALLGETLEGLRGEIGPHVARTVGFFITGCRYGGVE